MIDKLTEAEWDNILWSPEIIFARTSPKHNLVLKAWDTVSSSLQMLENLLTLETVLGVTSTPPQNVQTCSVSSSKDSQQKHPKYSRIYGSIALAKVTNLEVMMYICDNPSCTIWQSDYP